MDKQDALGLLDLEIEDSSHICIIHFRHMYRASLRIARKDPENLQILHHHFGGYLSQAKNGYWIWTVVDRRCMRLLHAVYPNLSAKKEHADILFELEASKKRTRRSRGAGLPGEEVQFRATLINRMKGLNSRLTADQKVPLD